MEKEQENQRVRITKMLLKDALTKLLYEKKIEKVTVSELCEAAGVNRSTFYKHYGSQFDVLDDIEKDFFHAAEEMLTHNEDGRSGICSFLEFLKKEREKIYVVIILAADTDFIKRVFNKIEMPVNHIVSLIKMPRNNTGQKHLYPELLYTASRVAGNIWMRTFYLCRYTLPTKH